MTPKKLKGMCAVGKELVDLKIENHKTLGELQREFYQAMRKHGVKWGHRVKNGVQGANPEWSMCHSFFINRIVGFLETKMMLERPDAFDAYEPPIISPAGHAHNFRNKKKICSCGMSKGYYDHSIRGFA